MIGVRAADPERDAERIAEIYAVYVRDAIVTFEEEPPTSAEMAARMAAVLLRTPWLVAEADGQIVGYAYASAHRERPGYRWSVDISAYVDEQARGRGVGKTLYAELVGVIRRQGFVNVYAGIALPNPASVALHESIGMRRLCVYEKVGWKLGRWIDVAWFAMQLNAPVDDGTRPPEPITWPQLRDGA